MRNLELKIPPPVWAAIAAFTMWALAYFVPLGRWDIPLHQPLGLIVVALGVILDLSGLYAFYQAKTTVNPMRPAQTIRLVTKGIYRLSRNPMYLGLVCMLVGWAMYLASGVALLVVPLFIWLLTRCQIVPEERVLHTRFGPAFVAYCTKVRRWI